MSNKIIHFVFFLFHSLRSFFIERNFPSFPNEKAIFCLLSAEPLLWVLTCVGRGSEKKNEMKRGKNQRNFLWFSIFHVIQQEVEREPPPQTHISFPRKRRRTNIGRSRAQRAREISKCINLFPKMKYNIFPHNSRRYVLNCFLLLLGCPLRENHRSGGENRWF